MVQWPSNKVKANFVKEPNALYSDLQRYIGSIKGLNDLQIHTNDLEPDQGQDTN